MHISPHINHVIEGCLVDLSSNLSKNQSTRPMLLIIVKLMSIPFRTDGFPTIVIFSRFRNFPSPPWYSAASVIYPLLVFMYYIFK